MLDLDIRGCGESWAVIAGRNTIVGRYSSEHVAVASLAGISRRLAPKTKRRCISCGSEFTSTGPGHRMCTTCRGKS